MLMRIDVLVKLQYDNREHGTSPLLNQLLLISIVGALYKFKEKKRTNKGK
jgi:hypothetical protein